MIQRAIVADAIAREIAVCIVECVHPWRVVLFGSRARGRWTPDSDYDVYVEVHAEEDSLRGIQDQLRSALAGRRGSVDLKVRGRGTIERRRDDPGTIEWDVAREGIVLFADPAAPDIAPSARVRESGPPDHVPESVREWVESAERNLRLCRLLWTTPEDYYWPEICWLSHQTCEKYLKALLVARYVRPPRTHKLEELLAALRRSGLDVPGLDADCALLTTHAILPRYPEGLKLGELDARAAFAAAERVVEAAGARLPPS